MRIPPDELGAPSSADDLNTSHKKRKHLYDSPKRKDKRDASDKCKVNNGHEDSVASGKETIV